MLDQLIEEINREFENAQPLIVSDYDPENHVLDLSTNRYWHAMLTLRHVIRLMCDEFFAYKKNGTNIDLFMLTPSVSSPMGPGSDSEAIPIQFGKLRTFLVDSSQFGFEPVLMNDFNLLYCYLPSMRGENFDTRHLNQFFHCEAEMRGGLEDVMSLVEEYIRLISEGVYALSNLVSCLSKSPEHSFFALKNIIASDKFKRITFDDAVSLLEKEGYPQYVRYTDHGRDISSDGEVRLSKIFSPEVPFWITHYDRDRVPFYQKPDPQSPSRTLNADLIFPPLLENSFGGEVVGCGQRQDDPKECFDSLNRQGLSDEPYRWYIQLRSLPQYVQTSGFGMGIERYITWVLCRDDIKEAIPYPRLKDVATCP